MNYTQLQSAVQALLNRRDVTTTQVQSFIQSAIQRIQRGSLRDPQYDGEARPLRIPAMETTLFVTVSLSMKPQASAAAGLVIPSDLLELINLIPTSSISGSGQTDFKRLEKVDITRATQAAVNTGIPRIYARQGGLWVLGPSPQIGDVIRVDYYQELSPLVNPTDTNVISIIAPDLIVYGALCFAGDFFTDIRKADWENRFKEIWSSLADQGMEDEENGGVSVQPAFGYPDDLNDGWDYYANGPYGMF